MKPKSYIYNGICELRDDFYTKELGCKEPLDYPFGAIIGLSTLIHFCTDKEILTLISKIRLKRAWSPKRPSILKIVKAELNPDVKHDKFYSLNGPFLKDHCDWRCVVDVKQQTFQVEVIEYDDIWRGNVPATRHITEICKATFKEIRNAGNLQKDFIYGIFDSYHVLNKLEEL